MKVVKKSNNSLIGIFNSENAESEVLELGFVVEDCDFIKNQAEKDCENLQYLESTDWQVTRHRDQVSLGDVTSWSDAEYQACLTKRQSAREEIIDTDALIKYHQVMG